MASVYDAVMMKGKMRYRKDRRLTSEENVPQEVKDVLTIDNIVDENGNVVVDEKRPEANELDAEDQKALEKEPDTEERSEDGKLPRVDTSDKKELAESKAEVEKTDEDKVADEIAQSVADAEDDDSEEEMEEQDQPTPPAKETPAPKVKEEPKKELAESQVDTRPFKSKVPQSKPGMGFPRRNGKTVDIFDGVTPHTHVKLVGGYPVPLSTKNFKAKTEKQIEERLIELGFQILDFTNLEQQRGMADESGLTNEDNSSDDGLSDERA